jgi:hypothetical protein
MEGLRVATGSEMDRERGREQVVRLPDVIEEAQHALLPGLPCPPIIASAASYPFNPLSRTPSTMRRFATRNTTNSGSALSAAPAMIGPYDSEL